MARPASRYVCQACGASAPRWEGRCFRCGAWDTLVETLVRESSRRSRTSTSGGSQPLIDAAPVSLHDLAPQALTRRPTRLAELDRVLGGGLVPGSLVLLGGEPGIGKSTLVLEAAAGVAAALTPGHDRVLYASGEESAAQVRLRAHRLDLVDGPVGRAILVLADTDVDRIIERASGVDPALLVVDSIQTVVVDALDGPAGSVGQVREAAARLLAYAKQSGTPVVLVGHVTKDGSLAGPKTLEHAVDAVLTLEGERYGTLRVLRAVKNRFGSTEEIGVFEMAAAGLREVTDPARAFLTEGPERAPGTAVAATLEGTRPLLVEVQALVAPGSGFGAPRRTVSGPDGNRLALLIAVLGRRAGIGLGDRDVYASLAGGLTISEPALDLPLALALASSARDERPASGTVAVGEVGLLGELRPVAGLERRLREAARLGFGRAIVPPGRPGETVADDLAPGLRVERVASLAEAIEVALERPPAGPG